MPTGKNKPKTKKSLEDLSPLERRELENRVRKKKQKERQAKALELKELGEQGVNLAKNLKKQFGEKKAEVKALKESNKQKELELQQKRADELKKKEEAKEQKAQKKTETTRSASPTKAEKIKTTTQATSSSTTPSAKKEAPTTSSTTTEKTETDFPFDTLNNLPKPPKTEPTEKKASKGFNPKIKEYDSSDEEVNEIINQAYDYKNLPPVDSDEESENEELENEEEGYENTLSDEDQQEVEDITSRIHEGFSGLQKKDNKDEIKAELKELGKKIKDEEKLKLEEERLEKERQAEEKKIKDELAKKQKEEAAAKQAEEKKREELAKQKEKEEAKKRSEAQQKIKKIEGLSSQKLNEKPEEKASKQENKKTEVSIEEETMSEMQKGMEARVKGNFEEAISIFEKNIANPNAKKELGLTYNNYAVAETNKKNHDKAEGLFTKAIDNGNIQAMANLGSIYSESNNPEKKKKGLELLSKAANVHDNIFAKYTLGQLSENNADFKNAKIWYEKAQESAKKQGNTTFNQQISESLKKIESKLQYQVPPPPPGYVPQSPFTPSQNASTSSQHTSNVSMESSSTTRSSSHENNLKDSKAEIKKPEEKKEGKQEDKKPQTAEEWYQTAKSQLDAGEYENAKFSLENAIVLDNMHKAANLSLAMLHLDKDNKIRKPNPYVAYNLLNKIADKSATAQYNLGRMYERGEGVSQNYETAKEWYTKANSSRGDNETKAKIKLMNAEIAMQKNQHDEAIKFFSEANELGYRKALERLEQLGNEFFNNGNLAAAYQFLSAAEEAKKLTAKKPLVPEDNAKLKDKAEQDLGNANKAIIENHIKEGIEARNKKDFPTAIQNLYIAGVSLNDATAKKEFVATLNEYGVSEFGKGNYKGPDGAEGLFIDALKYSPNDEAIKKNLSRTYMELGFEAGTKINNIIEDRNYYDETVSYFKKAIELGNISAKSYLGYFYFHFGEPDSKNEGLALIQEAAAQGDALALYNLGKIHQNDKEIDKARDLYEKARERAELAGQTYLIGEIKKSLESLETAEPAPSLKDNEPPPPPPGTSTSTTTGTNSTAATPSVPPSSYGPPPSIPVSDASSPGAPTSTTASPPGTPSSTAPSIPVVPNPAPTDVPPDKILEKMRHILNAIRISASDLKNSLEKENILSFDSIIQKIKILIGRIDTTLPQITADNLKDSSKNLEKQINDIVAEHETILNAAKELKENLQSLKEAKDLKDFKISWINEKDWDDLDEKVQDRFSKNGTIDRYSRLIASFYVECTEGHLQASDNPLQKINSMREKSVELWQDLNAYKDNLRGTDPAQAAEFDKYFNDMRDRFNAMINTKHRELTMDERKNLIKEFLKKYPELKLKEKQKIDAAMIAMATVDLYRMLTNKNMLAPDADIGQSATKVRFLHFELSIDSSDTNINEVLSRMVGPANATSGTRNVSAQLQTISDGVKPPRILYMENFNDKAAKDDDAATAYATVLKSVKNDNGEDLRVAEFYTNGIAPKDIKRTLAGNGQVIPDNRIISWAIYQVKEFQRENPGSNVLEVVGTFEQFGKLANDYKQALLLYGAYLEKYENKARGEFIIKEPDLMFEINKDGTLGNPTNKRMNISDNQVEAMRKQILANPTDISGKNIFDPETVQKAQFQGKYTARELHATTAARALHR